MQEGAFALIDCLGFKGIWKRTNPELILEKFERIEKTIQGHLDSIDLGTVEYKSSPETVSSIKFFSNYIDSEFMKLEIRLLSDTVAVSLQYENPKEREEEKRVQRAVLIKAMCGVITKILDLFIEGECPLVLRGCITYGEHICKKNFIIGPAVDEAAEHMNIPEGAFVWLHPSAALFYNDYQEGINEIILSFLDQKSSPEKLTDIEKEGLATLDTLIGGTEVIQYEMPIKGGSKLKCFVLNPLSNYKEKNERQKIIDVYSELINGDKLDIWLKRQNTLGLLNSGNEICNKFYEVYESLVVGIGNFIREFIKLLPDKSNQLNNGDSN